MTTQRSHKRTRRRASVFDKVIVLGVLGGATGVCIYLVMKGKLPTTEEAMLALQLSIAGLAALLVFFGATLLGAKARGLVQKFRCTNTPQAANYLLLVPACRELGLGAAWYSAGVVALYLLYWWSPLEHLGWNLFAAIVLVTGVSGVVGAVMGMSQDRAK